jgi:S-formylglutathione hydrolase
MRRGHAISVITAIRICCGAFPLAAVAQGGGVIHRDSVPAPALEHNMVGDPAWDRVSVYLPPSYHRRPLRRYPVLYFLHGFAADDRAIVKGAYQNLNIRISMDSLVRVGAMREMIVVMPNARNAYDGSFYTDSPVTGNWEQFIARDLVDFIDRKYRTLRTRKARGLAGHSMGGYGALRIAMRHPETFSAVYGLSACCLAFTDTVERTYQNNWRAALALRSWDEYKKAGFITNLLVAEGAANAPDTANPPFFVSFPYVVSGDSLVLDQKTARRWAVRPLAMVRDHAGNLRRLAIAFDAGTADAFKDIPIRAAELDRLLTELGIHHSFELYDGTHGSRIRSRMETKVLPFFSKQLAGAR